MRISDWSSDVCSSDLNARLRGMAGLDALRRSARVVILHHAPRKAGGQADGLCRLLRPFGAAEQKAGCGSRRADGPARAARLIPEIEMTRLHGKRCTEHDLVTGSYRCPQFAARRTCLFCQGQRDRQHDDAGVQHAADMPVVSIEEDRKSTRLNYN